jgi:hypothetical protein
MPPLRYIVTALPDINAVRRRFLEPFFGTRLQTKLNELFRHLCTYRDLLSEIKHMLMAIISPADARSCCRTQAGVDICLLSRQT